VGIIASKFIINRKVEGSQIQLLSSCRENSKLAKPNYSYEKRQRDIAKKKKKEEKRKSKQEKNSIPPKAEPDQSPD
jgi:hypothetical protein